MAGGQLTSLLSNQMLARAERLRLQTKRRLTNRSRGEHLAGKGGTSTEFNDFRDYVPGDDMRYVDWNIFARLGRPYVRQYRLEEESYVVIIVDGSSSMDFGEKFTRAKELAALFAITGMVNQEPVSLYHGKSMSVPVESLRKASGRVGYRPVFQFLEGLAAGGEATIEEAVRAVLKRHRGRGLAIVLSDFLTAGPIDRMLNELYEAGLEPWCVQILSAAERNPDVTGDLRLIDSEQGHNLDVSSVGDLLGIYREHLVRLEEHIASLCRQRAGRYISIEAERPVEELLTSSLIKQGWLS